jgi:simple sugar transport system ATP-binding protein/D-xylose transport system ATP-binding protein
VLSLRGIDKNFGAVAALTGVELDVAEGEVVAIVGDNGAGKSTLVKVLAGVHRADAGTIRFDDREVTIASPADARALGIATVFQDLALCENLDVVQNLFLGAELRRPRLDEVAMEVRSWELLRQLSAKIPTVRIPVPSPSRGRCSATRRSSSSTSRRRRSASRRRPRCSTSSSGSASGASG